MECNVNLFNEYVHKKSVEPLLPVPRSEALENA